MLSYALLPSRFDGFSNCPFRQNSKDDAVLYSLSSAITLLSGRTNWPYLAPCRESQSVLILEELDCLSEDQVEFVHRRLILLMQ